MDKPQDKPPRSIVAVVWQFILNRVWYVHPTVILMIQASPAACLQTLAMAAKPSTQRLHLRNLFASGRRYELHLLKSGGFTLTTTSKLIWRYRQRTRPSALLLARFSNTADDITRIQMRVRINLIYLLDVFLIPTFVASIIVFTPWHPVVIGGLLVVLYLLSWFGHRFGAALEANEMVFFVQKALEDLVPAEIFSLNPDTSNIIYSDREFNQEWERFYEEHKNE